MQQQSCPCGSSLPYHECCGPCLEGLALPQTAEQLMRSRYTAYVRGDWQYLTQTWHASTRPAQLGDDAGVQWQGLEIRHRFKGGVSDISGSVEFVATCRQHGKVYHLHEISRFQRESGRWFYVDGIVRSGEARPGRNDPCVCGSGRKFKKCCGKPAG